MQESRALPQHAVPVDGTVTAVALRFDTESLRHLRSAAGHVFAAVLTVSGEPVLELRTTAARTALASTTHCTDDLRVVNCIVDLLTVAL